MEDNCGDADDDDGDPMADSFFSSTPIQGL